METIFAKIMGWGDYVACESLMELMGYRLWSKSRIWNFRCARVNVATLWENHLPLPLNTHRLQKLTESYVVSNAKIIAAIGKPLPANSKEGLLKTFKSFE
jgi:hypothetical protein